MVKVCQALAVVGPCLAVGGANGYDEAPIPPIGEIGLPIKVEAQECNCQPELLLLLEFIIGNKNV